MVSGDSAVWDVNFSESGNAVGNNSYMVKWISFQGAMYAVIMQNENGPCPLLAIANVLLLRGQISLPLKASYCTEKDLLDLIVECILRLKPQDLDEAGLANYEQTLSDVLSLVPSLRDGLDVNLYFTGVREFEYTAACALFDLLSIPLLHGWIVDKHQTELVKLLQGLGYNQAVEKMVTASGDTKTTILADFLENSASQLTYQGLSDLQDSLKDGDIAVLFRNNHFHTLYKNQDDLFVLVTDQGFLNEPTVVWETLNRVDGDSSFVNSSFSTSETSRAVDEYADYLLALKLQDEEELGANSSSSCEVVDNAIATKTEISKSEDTTSITPPISPEHSGYNNASIPRRNSRRSVRHEKNHCALM